MAVCGSYYKFYCSDDRRPRRRDDGVGRLLQPDAGGVCTVAPQQARYTPRWYELLAKEIVRKGTPIKGVTALRLGGCLMGDQGMEWVGGSLVVFAESKGLEALRELDLSGNRLTDASVDNLATLVRQLKGLRRLRVSQNYFSPGALAAVTELLAARTSVRSAYFGTDCAQHEGMAQLMHTLRQRAANTPSDVRSALINELEGTYSEHKRSTRMQLQATERSEVEAKETRKRSEIANSEHEARCEILRRYAMGRDNMFTFEARVHKARAAIASERENQILNLYIKCKRARMQIEEFLRVKEKVLALDAYASQFFERFMKSERETRAVLGANFARGIGSVMGRERSALGTVEIDARCAILEQQEEERKRLMGEGRHLLKVKPGASRSRRKDMVYVERANRNTVVSEEFTERNMLMDDERAHKQQAREATYLADQAPMTGPLRVLVREEAHCRLEISDLEDAERQECNIGVLLDVPCMQPEQQEATKKIKEQQKEEYRAKKRERSVAKMDDLRGGGYGFSFSPALSASFARSFAKTPPSLGVREARPG